MVEEAVTLLRNGGRRCGPSHEVRFEADAGPHVCLADPDQIAQVFWNLARNALEAMPDGGRLEVRLRREGGDVVLTVRDQGRGMGRDEQGRLFEPSRTSPRWAPASASRSCSGSCGSTAATSRCAARPSRAREIDVRLPLVPASGPAAPA